MKIKEITFLMFLLFNFPAWGSVFDGMTLENIDVIKNNNRAVEKIKQYFNLLTEETQKAQAKAQQEGRSFKPEDVDIDPAFLNQALSFELQALSEDPDNSSARLNLAIIFELLKQLDKAAIENEAIIKSEQNPELKFYAFFNLARVRAEQKNISEALKNYQLALDINPDSQEVKNNIELLWMGQGQGSGEGDNSDGSDQDKKDQDGNGDKDKDKDDKGDSKKPVQNGKKQPRKYKGPLSKNDVRKILEEITNQEQKIRAEEYQKGSKESPREKDW
ncbi:MAG: hypothetical protein KDD50_02670 [Bdellovibrionales bacterium]|nr:hypothetical protein [Bdellovibrionales bacterium]